MEKTLRICMNALPVLIMIGLIPFVRDDYALVLIYIAVIILSLLVRRERYDGILFVFGFFAMIASELLFISTGVEVFLRHSLFGLMPLWLPFLWGYGFIAIKRSVNILQDR